jgi:hypothetical protein
MTELMKSKDGKLSIKPHPGMRSPKFIAFLSEQKSTTSASLSSLISSLSTLHLVHKTANFESELAEEEEEVEEGKEIDVMMDAEEESNSPTSQETTQLQPNWKDIHMTLANAQFSLFCQELFQRVCFYFFSLLSYLLLSFPLLLLTHVNV